ncbi:MAG TPA: hypothetical protein VFG72_06765 [Marmoricola sp.]|nr:hypothetical protein [Marmoricola sp.]
MSEFEEFDLERSSAKAWRSFQARVADHVAAMKDDDALIVQLAVGMDREVGAAPYVQFFMEQPDRMRCEVVSNHYLAPTHALSTEDQDALVSLGFATPTHARGQAVGGGSANFHVDLRRTEADRLARNRSRCIRTTARSGCGTSSRGR